MQNAFIHIYDENGKDLLRRKENYADTVSLDALLYCNFIKYDKLKELTLTQFANSNSNELNIYIDMYSMIKPLYNRTILGDNTLFTSFILNLAAHMRSYYMTRHNVITNIYIIFTSNTSILTQEISMVPEWNITDINKYIQNDNRIRLINWNVQLLQLLVPCFPRLYFVNGTAEPAVMIMNLINKNTNKIIPNVVVTKDKFSWLIPTIDNNSCIFRPRKTKDSDESYCINHSNVFNEWRSSINRNIGAPEIILPPEMLSLYIAYTNFKQRGLNSYYSPREAIRRIWKLVQDNKIRLGYNSPEAISSVLLNECKKCSYQYDFEKFSNNLYYRYNMVDLNRLTTIYSTTPEASNMSWCYSKIDDNSIKEINDKYFIKNPIDIIRLLKHPR